MVLQIIPEIYIDEGLRRAITRVPEKSSWNGGQVKETILSLFSCIIMFSWLLYAGLRQFNLSATQIFGVWLLLGSLSCLIKAIVIDLANLKRRIEEKEKWATIKRENIMPMGKGKGSPRKKRRGWRFIFVLHVMPFLKTDVRRLQLVDAMVQQKTATRNIT